MTSGAVLEASRAHQATIEAETLSSLQWEGCLDDGYRNEVEIAFGDGVAFALWLNGTDAGGCCAFRGGPYTESRFFGEGVGIALRRDNQAMKRALDYALKRVAERGVYADLYLKYFPVGFY